MLWTLPVLIIHQKFFLAYANLVIFIIGGILIGGGGGGAPGSPDYAYDYNFNGICDIKILYASLVVCHCVHIKAALMVLFCDYAKYVILLVKVKIVLNNSCNLKL